MLRKVLSVITLLPGLAMAQGPAQTTDALATARAQFVEALAGVPRGMPEEDDGDLVRSYPLYPYLQAERLQRALTLEVVPGALDETLSAFLVQHGDAPWTRGLRVAFLRKLAERQQWPLLLTHFVEARADLALRCNRVAALIATTPDPSLRQAGLTLWRTGSEMPAACAPVFDWLRAQNALTPAEIAGRTRLALEAGKLAVVRMLLPQLPPDQRAPYELWLAVLDDPARNLERAVRAGLEPRAIYDGFARLARSSHERASGLLLKLETICVAPCVLAAPASVGELRREIALNQAWSRLPEALENFRLVPDVALDERGHEWRVRVALWNGEWKLAGDWIACMPAPLAAQPRWRYWRARTLEKQSQSAVARPLYEKLLDENGYYALLAAERLDRTFTPRNKPRPGDPAARARMATQAGFVRAREAWAIDQQPWARSEWNEATAGFDESNLLDAAHLASDFGWHLMAVATATRAEVFDDFALLYPRPYETELREAARRTRLPPEWIWAVLRQESLYDPRARSSADALGLLQLLPETARAVARRSGLPAPTREELFMPGPNLLLGAAYLREQMSTFGGRFILVLGAYNAGPNAVRRWLGEEVLDADVWIENVPFNETRSYIQRILWHSSVFAWQMKGEAQRITPFLVDVSSDLTPLAQAGG